MPLMWQTWSSSYGLPSQKRQIHPQSLYVINFDFKICFGKSRSTGLSALQPVESIQATNVSAPASLSSTIVPELDISCMHSGSISISISDHSTPTKINSPFISPHPIIPVYLKFPD